MIQIVEYISILAQNSKTYQKTTTNQSYKLKDSNYKYIKLKDVN